MDVGARLRNTREARGMSIASLSEITRLAPRWLETIERNDPSVFPPGPYARGYVRAYARELGLDPDEIAREYFAQFPPPQAPAVTETTTRRDSSLTDARSPFSFIALAVIASGVVLALLAWSPWRDGAAGPRESGAVGTSGQLGAALTPAPNSAATSARALPSDALTVTLTADEPVWITATADGKRVLFQLFAPGARETLRANRQLTIRVGNAGGVHWTVGGRDVGRMGAPGAVRTVSVTPENVGTVR